MKRNIAREKKTVYFIALGLIALIGYFFNGNLRLHPNSQQKLRAQPAINNSYDYGNILVTRVVDGDTLKLEDGQYLRLLGIDTPEMHESAKLERDALRSKQSVEAIKQMGRESYAFTRQMVEGKRVRLEFDTERQDKYNRLLAYVFLHDGTFLNARIVEEGYASITHYKLNVKYADLFLKLYQQARENRRGLWR
jgi:micrococcal nuclease